MVVCKFFQQGHCRYGQSCRFEHIFGSKYSYHAPQTSSAPPGPPSAGGVTDEQLVNQVQSDLQAALHGGQWLLSGYAPFKEKPALPGLQDLSFEEARLFIYEAKANNNVDQAVAYMNKLYHEARLKHEQLVQPTPAIMKTLRSLYKGEMVTSPFNNTQNNAFGTSSDSVNGATSVFRSAVQGSGFGQANSTVFSQNSGNIFGAQSDNSPAKSLFAQAAQSQNVFGSNTQTSPNAFAPSSNVFGQSSDVAAKSIFAQANQSAFSSNQTSPASIFAAANQNVSSDPFAQRSPFQSNNTASAFPSQSASIFQTPEQPSNVFGAAMKSVFEQEVADDGVTYTNLEYLTQEDFEAFQADSFQLGFVPEVPPPRSLCI